MKNKLVRYTILTIMALLLFVAVSRGQDVPVDTVAIKAKMKELEDRYTHVVKNHCRFRKDQRTYCLYIQGI